MLSENQHASSKSLRVQGPDPSNTNLRIFPSRYGKNIISRIPFNGSKDHGFRDLCINQKRTLDFFLAFTKEEKS